MTLPSGSAAARSHTLADAALALNHDRADLERLIADAVHSAETPRADQCVLPGVALEVQIEVGGRVLTARRESERTDDWRLLLPGGVARE